MTNLVKALIQFQVFAFPCLKLNQLRFFVEEQFYMINFAKKMHSLLITKRIAKLLIKNGFIRLILQKIFFAS